MEIRLDQRILSDHTVERSDQHRPIQRRLRLIDGKLREAKIDFRRLQVEVARPIDEAVQLLLCLNRRRVRRGDTAGIGGAVGGGSRVRSSDLDAVLRLIERRFGDTAAQRKRGDDARQPGVDAVDHFLRHVEAVRD